MIGLFALKIAHVLAAAVWIGASLGVPGDIRRTLELGPPHTAVLMARLRAVARIMNLSALLTVLTGLGLVFGVGGFSHVPHRIHASLALTLLAIAAGRWLIRPAIGQIARAIHAPVSTEQARRLLARFWIGNALEHLFRVAVLVLMIYPFAF